MKYSFNLEDKRKNSFHPLVEESQILKQEITPSSATTDIETEIADVANQGDYDLLLIGLENLFLKVLF
jgi:hypothetical protein